MRLLGGCLALAGLATWGLQGFLWLKSGYWSPLSVGWVLALFDVQPVAALNDAGWRGVGIAVAWVLDQSMGAMMFIIGMVMMAFSDD